MIVSLGVSQREIKSAVQIIMLEITHKSFLYSMGKYMSNVFDFVWEGERGKAEKIKYQTLLPEETDSWKDGKRGKKNFFD